MSNAIYATVPMPAGRYWLGDPCYSFSDQDPWIEMLETCNYFIDSCKGRTPHGDVLAFSTAYGDGVYYDNEGNSYGVDAGLIGLVPAGVRYRFKTDSSAETKSWLGEGRWLEFSAPFTAESFEDGTLRFGDVEICTDHIEDEDE